MRCLWRRFRDEGKIPAAAPEPRRPQDLCGHPINFLVGGTDGVARQLADLHAACAFDVVNFEVRWDGLSPEAIRDCMHLLAEELRPSLARLTPLARPGW